MTATAQKLPPRHEVPLEHTWDLSSLFANDEQWREAFRQFEQKIEGYAQYQGQLGESPQVLAQCLAFDAEVDRLGERLGIYAFLKTAEDQTDSTYQAMQARFQNVATRASQLASFIRPEIMAIAPEKMDRFQASDELKLYRLMLERLLRYRPYTLSDKEERLLAMQGEMAQAARQASDQLRDSDMKFGTVKDAQGREIELSNATFGQLLYSPDRNVRETAFHQYYEQYDGHRNTLSATLSGSILTDVYYSKVRGYDGSLQAALFADNVPQTVYDSLIESVRRNLPALYRYYELRRRKMNLDEIHHYDTYVPILADLEVDRSWEEAVELVLDSLKPLGEEYLQVLSQGLRGRWCDRYPNAGKRSGAFSCGSFDGDPYIMMNYKPNVFDDVFTLAHEAGHSMHSFYSAREQPFLYYDYAIFVAEVASTFNEQLLSSHMMARAQDDRERAYLINREIDGIRGTIIRQTMFAEFEKLTHEMAEAGEPLTVQSFREVYGKLLKDYFGPDFTIDEQLSLECFRIPHFYRAFYVYKYATGLSAAIALSKRVLEGGESELHDYLGFLQGGCSKFPLDLLRGAGVDMEQPEPVDTALAHFENLVDQLEQLLD